jgi:hypothetical protein
LQSCAKQYQFRVIEIRLGSQHVDN